MGQTPGHDLVALGKSLTQEQQRHVRAREEELIVFDILVRAPTRLGDGGTRSG